MNTNIQVSLTDEQRDHIANLYHNKDHEKDHMFKTCHVNFEHMDQ